MKKDTTTTKAAEVTTTPAEEVTTTTTTTKATKATKKAATKPAATKPAATKKATKAETTPATPAEEVTTTPAAPAEKPTKGKKHAPRTATKAEKLDKPTAPAAPPKHEKVLPRNMICMYPFIKANLTNPRKLAKKAVETAVTGPVSLELLERLLLELWDASFDALVAPPNDYATITAAVLKFAEVLKLFPREKVCKDTPPAVVKDGDEYVKPAADYMKRVYNHVAVYKKADETNTNADTKRAKTYTQKAPGTFIKEMEDLIVDIIDENMFLSAAEIQKRQKAKKDAEKAEKARERRNVKYLLEKALNRTLSRREVNNYLMSRRAVEHADTVKPTADTRKKAATLAEVVTASGYTDDDLKTVELAPAEETTPAPAKKAEKAPAGKAATKPAKAAETTKPAKAEKAPAKKATKKATKAA